MMISKWGWDGERGGGGGEKVGGREKRKAVFALSLFSTDGHISFLHFPCLFIYSFLALCNLCHHATGLQVYTWMRPFPGLVLVHLLFLAGLSIGDLRHNGWAVVMYSQQAVVGGEHYCFRHISSTK